MSGPIESKVRVGFGGVYSKKWFQQGPVDLLVSMTPRGRALFDRVGAQLVADALSTTAVDFYYSNLI